MHRIDLTTAQWHQSSYSQTSGGNCVEVAAMGGHVAVRDSKNRDDGALVFAVDTWHAFLDSVDDLS